MLTMLAVEAATAPDFNSQVAVALIATAGGIITTLLTVKYRGLVVKRGAPQRPKDRMDTIFDGYEKLILQQQQEIDRKQTVIQSLEDIVDNLERELVTTRQLLIATKDEVAETKRQNISLKAQLNHLRKEYGSATIEK